MNARGEHVPCRHRVLRAFGGARRAFCRVHGDSDFELPFCEYCRDKLKERMNHVRRKSP